MGNAGDDPSDDLIAEIYEAALDPQAFGRLSGLIARATKSVNGIVVLRDRMIPVALSATIPSEAAEAYVTHYGRIDPWADLTLRALDRIVASEDLISDQAILNTEFYVDYARHLGMFHPMGTTCLVTPDLRVTIGVNRPRDAQPYSEADKLWLMRLARHVQWALQLRQRCGALQSGVRAGFAVLDSLDFAVVVPTPNSGWSSPICRPKVSTARASA